MSAWITAGATLLGGLLSKPKPKYVVPDYAGIRKGAEAAGFNPLTALTQGPAGSVVDMAGGMGASIAEAGLMLADSLAKSSAASKLSQAQAQNAKLKAQVTNLTLRPKVAGIYAQRQAVPSLARALGASNGPATSAVPAVSSVAHSARVEASPFAGAVVGPDDNNLTGPQLSVKKDVPAFRAFGHDFYGSGLFSTAQQFEDSLGEGELLQTGTAAVLGTDAVLNEAYKGYQRYIGEPFARAAEAALYPRGRRPKPVGKRPAWLPVGAYP